MLNRYSELELSLKTAFLTLSGSHAYGTAMPGSDVDVAGVYLGRKEDYLGLHEPPEQYNDKPTMTYLFKAYTHRAQKALENTVSGVQARELEVVDGTVFEVKKFMRLAAESNPNILDILFADDRCIIYSDREWDTHVLAFRDAFLSKKVYWTFRGYAKNQLDRMERHRKWLLDPPKAPPSRADFGLPDGGRAVPSNQYEAVQSRLRDILDRWEIKFDDNLPRSEVLKVQEVMRSVLEEILRADETLTDRALASMGLETNFIDLVKREHAFDREAAHWASYCAWKAGRNPKRAELEAKCGYDAKHAMHCLRLLKQTESILRTKTYRPYNPDIVEELKEVRQGLVGYDDVRQRMKDAEGNAAKAFDRSTLPNKPDWAVINGSLLSLLS